MSEVPSEEEQDRESHRSHILTLGGFSFAGLLAISALDVTSNHDFRFAVYFLLASFLCYLFSLNLQGYKSKRWHDQFATALMDSASLSLIMSIISILQVKALNLSFVAGITGLALLVWAVDHIVRIRILWKYLKLKREVLQNDGSKQR